MCTESPDKIDLSPNKDGGVLKEILKKGDCCGGRPANGDKVLVHYVGTLANGEKFDSSRDRGEKFEFQLGVGQVIKAWDLGVASMNKGEVARLTCTADYAYGKNGSPPKIPPDATLIFEVELFSWKGDDISPNKDGGIIRQILTKGEGHKQPKEDSTVMIHYLGKYNGVRFEERDVEFIVGEGIDKDVIPGIEMAVVKMNKGEKSHFKIAPQYAYGSEGHKEFGIPPDATLEYEIYLSNFEKAKEGYEMDVCEKLEQSDVLKSKGGNMVKGAQYPKAIKCYKKIVEYLEFETESACEKDEWTKIQSLLLASHLNLALCYLKTQENNYACDHCDKAIQIDPNNIKAFFRRGQAYFNKQDYELAKVAFSDVLKLESDNKAAKNQIIICDHHIKTYQDKERKKYAGMFQKFAAQDQKNPDKYPIPKSGEVMDNIDDWSNDLAQGMMTIEQELEAFGEVMPQIDKENLKPKRK